MPVEPNPAKGEEKTARERQAKGWANLRPARKGEVRNKEGINGHRVRQELIAAILDEADDDPLDPGGCSRIRSVILAAVRDAKAGGPGAGTAQKMCIEQYSGKPRQQYDLTSSDHSMSPCRKPTTAEARQELDRIMSALDGCSGVVESETTASDIATDT